MKYISLLLCSGFLALSACSSNGDSSSDDDGLVSEVLVDAGSTDTDSGTTVSSEPEAPAVDTSTEGTTGTAAGESTDSSGGREIADGDTDSVDAVTETTSESISSGLVESAFDAATSGLAVESSRPIGPFPIEPIPVEPQPPVQSGILTAADYDDQLNPWLYERYSNNYLQNFAAQTQTPQIDLSTRITVRVTNGNGEPMPGAKIAVLRNDGNSEVTAITTATGVSYLYPELDGLGNNFTLTIEDRYGDVSTTTDIVLNDSNGLREYTIELDAASVAHTELDLQLVLDTTASMGDELSYLQAELSSILDRVQNDNPQVSIRAGLVVYRDVGDAYVVRSYPFTDDISAMQTSLNRENYAGGGDYPEAMDQALAEALTFDWREQSAKVSLLVADAPPHNDRFNATWDAAKEARSKQIHIVPVAASGVADEAEYLIRSMAALTNSRYLFLTDDSGVGLAHDEPDVDCYIVTRLDGLIERVVSEIITGNRTEPSSAEVVRQVGVYDNGVCSSDGQQ